MRSQIDNLDYDLSGGRGQENAECEQAEQRFRPLTAYGNVDMFF
jgi:hypothetical protein